MSEIIVFTNRWQIKELNAAKIKDLCFGQIDQYPVGQVTKLEDEKVSDEQLQAAINLGSIMGDFDKTRWLYSSLQVNIDNLLNNFALKEDGLVDITTDCTKNYLIHVRADAYIHSIVASAKRFIDSREAMLRKRFGKDSNQFKEWRKTVNSAYDKSIIYALLYELRNRLEHDFWIISLVNVDMNELKAGFAINIDNDLLNSDHPKSSTKKSTSKMGLGEY